MQERDSIFYSRIIVLIIVLSIEKVANFSFSYANWSKELLGAGGGEEKGGRRGGGGNAEIIRIIASNILKTTFVSLAGIRIQKISAKGARWLVLLAWFVFV